MRRVGTTAPSRFRRAVFTAILALGLAGCLELGSAVVLYLAGGKLVSPAAARAEREAVQRQARPRSNVPSPASSGEEDRDWAPEVVHPFLGFVRDPTFEGARIKLNRLGFPDTAPPVGPAAERFTLGVFGGSVAVNLSRSGRLIEELRRSPAFRDKKIWVRSFALSGYKQPQQLMALNYALASGERLDAVVNLDGFNDVALGAREHEATGLHPSYPRRWHRRVSRLPDVESQRLAGEIAYLEAVRAARAARCSWAPLSLSPTCHLGWKVLDARTARRLAALRDALSSRKSSHRQSLPGQYLALGPRIDYAGEELLRELSELWGRSSLQMHQLCAAQGIRYFHFLQPNQYSPGSKTFSPEERRQAFSDEHPWGEIIPRGYPLLARAGSRLEAQGVSFHDLRMLYRDVEDTLYIDSCCHLNPRGMELLARAIADTVVRDEAIHSR